MNQRIIVLFFCSGGQGKSVQVVSSNIASKFQRSKTKKKRFEEWNKLNGKVKQCLIDREVTLKRIQVNQKQLKVFLYRNRNM